MPGLLYADSIPITKNINIRIPTVGEILANEDEFDEIVSCVVATPYELMVPLADAGIEFDKVSHFDVFCMLFPKLQEKNVSTLFGDTDFSEYRYAINTGTNEGMWVNEKNDSRIDRVIHSQMCSVIRKILHLTVNDKKPGNDEARRYMLERARRKSKRRRKEKSSQLESYIVAMVNSKDFKYDYSSVRDISIFQFYSSLQQITHRIQFDNTMIGCYTGSIKFDDVSEQNKTWIISTNN